MATKGEECIRKGFEFSWRLLFSFFAFGFIYLWSLLPSQASTAVPPQLWQPSSGILMTNDISETNLVKAVPCFALSKNDSYVLSASGGKISLFNMLTFKVMHCSGCNRLSFLPLLWISVPSQQKILISSPFADNDNIYAPSTSGNIFGFSSSRQQCYCYWHGGLFHKNLQCPPR